MTNLLVTILALSHEGCFWALGGASVLLNSSPREIQNFISDVSALLN